MKTLNQDLDTSWVGQVLCNNVEFHIGSSKAGCAWSSESDVDMLGCWRCQKRGLCAWKPVVIKLNKHGREACGLQERHALWRSWNCVPWLIHELLISSLCFGLALVQPILILFSLLEIPCILCCCIVSRCGPVPSERKNSTLQIPLN